MTDERQGFEALRRRGFVGFPLQSSLKAASNTDKRIKFTPAIGVRLGIGGP